MKLNFLPKTSLGKWSVGFGMALVALFLFSAILAGLSQQKTGNEIIINPIARPFLIIGGLLAVASGLSAFFTGIVSFVKYKERSIFIYITTFIGFLVVMFLLGEFLIPH